MSPTRARILRIALVVTVAVLLTGGYLALRGSGLVEQVRDAATLQAWLRELGIAGPLLIIGLMTLAIVMSPIPSAPIALAAGAAYGHTAGGIYVLIGAELGAVIAFLVTRLLGVDVTRRWLGDELKDGWLASHDARQNTLMGIVFVSRLLPFISFDVVSYAAGLTSLSFWRFAIATLAGIIPASFLLAHFGAELTSGDSRRIALVMLVLGVITLVPLSAKLYRRWRRRDVE